MIKIGHIRSDHGEYIGRPSPLGNPFVIGRDGTRKEVVDKYYDWLMPILCNQPDHPATQEINRLRRIYEREGELTLLCWCAPEQCHGEVVAYFIDEEAYDDEVSIR